MPAIVINKGWGGDGHRLEIDFVFIHFDLNGMHRRSSNLHAFDVDVFTSRPISLTIFLHEYAIIFY